MRASFISVPYFIGDHDSGLAEPAEETWHLLAPSLPDGTPQVRMAVLYRELAEVVAEVCLAGDLPVVVAGDCLSAIGVLAGLQRAGVSPVLIWFDAHGDFNTWETTPSGFLGGMPLAMLVGRGEQTIVQKVGLTCLPESDLILVDARDLDPGEREAVRASAVTHLPHVEDLLAYPLPDRPLYVHLDVDVVDPTEIPGVNYAARGGPSLATVGAALHRLAETGRVVAVSLSAWTPRLDGDGTSRGASMRLLNELVFW
jgi:arginase